MLNARENGSEGAPLRAATGVPPTSSWSNGRIARRFTAEYRLRVLLAADACSRSGEIGALLRREGLRTSHLPDREGITGSLRRLS